MIKLLALDVDGTLLDDSGEISSQNKDAIRQAREKGVMVVIASGRSLKSLELYDEILELRQEGCYTIGFNGGVICKSDTREVVHELMLKKAYAKMIFKSLEKFDANILFYIRDELYAAKRNEATEAYEKASRRNITTFEDLNTLDTDISKILISGQTEQLKMIQKHTDPIVNGICTSCFSASTLFEFSHIDAHKGFGLITLANMLGIEAHETMAMGDNDNDLTMIQAAGIGVVPRNAKNELKPLASYVTENDNNNSAVAEAIRKYIL